MIKTGLVADTRRPRNSDSFFENFRNNCEYVPIIANGMNQFPFHFGGAPWVSCRTLIDLAPKTVANLAGHEFQALGLSLQEAGIPAAYHAPALYQIVVGYSLFKPLPVTRMHLYRTMLKMSAAAETQEVKQWIHSLTELDDGAANAVNESTENELTGRLEHLLITNSWESDSRMYGLLKEAIRQYDAFFGPRRIQDIPALWVYYMKLRFQAHSQSNEDLEHRLSDNPRPTAEERDIYDYYEGLEPQVRDAVLVLRRKGYPTDISGFSPWGTQMIRLETTAGEVWPNQITLPEKLIHEVEHLYGVAIRTSQNSVAYLPSRRLTLGELKTIWDKIAQAMPDLERPVPPIRGYQTETWKARFR